MPSLQGLTFIGAGVLAGAMAYAMNWLALIPWRRSQGQHWTERARCFHPVRMAAGQNLWAMPAVFAMATQLFCPEYFPPWPLVAAVTALGGLAATLPLNREVFPRIALRELVRQTASGALLRGLGWVVFLGAAALMPREFDTLAFAIAAGVACLIVLWTLDGGTWASQRLGLLAPAPERLRQIVAGTSAKMNIPCRRLWVMRVSVAQALAVPATGTLLFTERALELLADDELAAICAHELGHLTESRGVRFQRQTALAAFLPWLFFKPLLHAWGIIGLFGLLLTTLGMLALFRSVSRRLESRADLIATSTAEEPAVYARALAKLHEDALLPAVLPGNQATHPHLYDRLLAAGVTPDYPRPAPAAGMAWPGQVFSAALGVLLFFFAMKQF